MKEKVVTSVNVCDSNIEQRPLWDRVEKLQSRPGSGSSSGSSNSSSQASPGERFRPRCESPDTVHLTHSTNIYQFLTLVCNPCCAVRSLSIKVFAVLHRQLKDLSEAAGPVLFCSLSLMWFPFISTKLLPNLKDHLCSGLKTLPKSKMKRTSGPLVQL